MRVQNNLITLSRERQRDLKNRWIICVINVRVLMVLIRFFLFSEWWFNHFAIMLLGEYLCASGWMYESKPKCTISNNDRILWNMQRWWLQFWHTTWCNRVVGPNFSTRQQNLFILNDLTVEFECLLIYSMKMRVCCFLCERR